MDNNANFPRDATELKDRSDYIVPGAAPILEVAPTASSGVSIDSTYGDDKLPHETKLVEGKPTEEWGGSTDPC